MSIVQLSIVHFEQFRSKLDKVPVLRSDQVILQCHLKPGMIMKTTYNWLNISLAVSNRENIPITHQMAESIQFYDVSIQHPE